MAQPPVLTPEQRTAALKKAAEARTARAELKEKLKMGSVTLSEALAKADSDDVIGNMRVLAMLEALPGVGKVKARRLMEDIEIAENRKVRGLGPKQRTALLEQLG
jgi:DNA uptake protein ComE-like DNA-binding protein